MKDLFNQIDVNQDGFLTMTETKNLYHGEENPGESGASTTPETQIWAQIKDELDKDGTAKVHFD